MSESPLHPAFKFRDLKIYASKEWLADNKKKYRQVFDRSEISYLYAELSFYNKWFDEKDWELSCVIKAFNAEDREVCNMNVQRKVNTTDNIVYIREGWGMDKPGAFWKKGEYRWEVFMNDQRIAQRPFYILDEGSVTQEDNPYLEIKTVRLYEADYNDRPESDRVYQTAFARDDTRYVWLEFKARNLLANLNNWTAELFFNFYADTGQLKGQIQELIRVDENDEELSCTVGWGSQKAGTWYIDDYKLEIVFMDQLICIVPFKVAEEAEELEDEDAPPFFIPDGTYGHVRAKTDGTNAKEEQLHSLEDLIGLETIKKKIADYTTYLQFIQFRRDKGIEDNTEINLHSVFIGNPGTGKTTVAKMLGKIYKELNLLEKGHVYEVDRSDLVGEYIGQTAPKVKEAIKKASGGILFIDEAYALARKGDDTKDFGKEVIEILLKEMSDGENNIAVIAAGYPEEMRNFLDSNPGLKSRINQVYEFPDYTPTELQDIAHFAADHRSVHLAKEAETILYQHLVEAYRTRDKTFGNARYVNSLIDAAKMNMGLRLMQSPDLNSLSEEQLSRIEKEDVTKIFLETEGKRADLPIDEALLKISLRELNDLVGLRKVKQNIEELVTLVRFYREIGKDPREEFSLHTIFKGNPGTGKTTVARIIANIYKALGILEKGHLVEVDRQKLVAGYLGQTAEKTDKVIDEATGGVLFIDEAYTLIHGESDSYGKEAIATLLKRMEDERGDFVVIVAGYPDNMEAFVNSNPGLRSRFDRTLIFEDYSEKELFHILEAMMKAEGVSPNKHAAQHLKEYLKELVTNRDKFFGNARTVRKIVEKAVKNQHLRLSQLEHEKRKPSIVKRVTLADVKEFTRDELMDNQPGIGFRRAGSSA